MRRQYSEVFSHLAGYKRESVIGPLFKLLEACFELAVPIIMARIIDVGIVELRDAGYVLRYGGIMVLMGLLGLACSLTAQFFAAKAALGFGTGLRSATYKKINSLSFSDIDGAGTGALITRITSDINQAQSGVNLVLRLFLRSPFIVLGAIVMSFTINARLALIFIAVTVLLSIVLYLITSRTLPGYAGIQGRLDKISETTRENLTGARVIRATGNQAGEERAFAGMSGALRDEQLRVGRISALMSPATGMIVNLGIVLVMWLGARVVFSGGASQGEVVALINYMTQILLALIALANLIVTFTRALASARRVGDLLLLNPSVADGPGDFERSGAGARVRFEGVSYAYPGADQPALEAIDFEAAPGQTIGVIGGTGAGKSTLVSLISRFYDPTAGRVTIDGADMRELTQRSIREAVGVVPQRAVLFSGTIRENLAWGNPDATDEEMLAALAAAQGMDIIAAKPEGLSAMVEQGGQNFSGGQRQRLTVARALIKRPAVLILDDSASALDYLTDYRLRAALPGYARGMTVFIVSQRISAVRGADMILVLEGGRPAGRGTHDELLAGCPAYADIAASQQHLSEGAVGA